MANRIIFQDTVYVYEQRRLLKGTQAWDNFDFFLPKPNPYMPFVNFWKKFRFFWLDFRQNFDVRTFPQWLSIRRTKFFWWTIPNCFLLQNLHFGPIRWVPGNDFITCWAYEERIFAHAQPAVKFEQFDMYNPCSAYTEQILSHTEHTRNKFHHLLSIRGTDFIECWACAEMFKSRISRPNRIRFSKISFYRSLGPYGFGFCKKSIKKFHACVPLTLSQAALLPPP